MPEDSIKQNQFEELTIKLLEENKELVFQNEEKEKRLAELVITNKFLKASEQKFRDLFENSVVGKSFTLPSGEMDVNNAMSAMLGYTSNELRGKPWQEITHPDDIEHTQLEIEALLNGEKASIRFIKRYVKKDGSIIWADVLSSIHRDADGEPLYLITSVIDITERKIAENLLRESEAKFKAVSELSPMAIYASTGSEQKAIYTNKAFYEMFGFTIDDVPTVGNWWIKAFPDEKYRQQVIDKWTESINQSTKDNTDVEALECICTCKDGSEKVIVWVGKILGDEFWAFGYDITEQNQNEENIKKQNEIMSTLLEVLPVGVFMVDANTGKPLLANDMARNLLGMGILPDATQKNFDEVYKGHRKGCTTPYPAEELPIVYGMKGISSHIDDLVVERPDDTEVLLEVYGTPILDEDGKPWASLATFTDITERTRAFEELDEALKFNQDIINSARNGVVVYDTELRYKIWNPSMESISGLSAQEVIGQSIEKIFPWQKETGVIDSLKLALEGKAIDENLFPFNIPETGKAGWALDNSGPLYNRKGDIVGVLGIVQDITQRKMAEDLLRESEERYRLLITKMEQGLALHKIILDKEGRPVDYRFLDANESFEKITGLKREDIIGKTVREALPDTEEYWIETYGNVALSGETIHYENYAKELGKYFEVVAYCPQPLHFAVIVADITQRKKDEESILYLGYHDQLTGLYNRRFYEEELKRLDVSRNLPFTIAMGDVNGLKLINDSFGHAAGDEMLKMTADIIKKGCRADDIIARIGGDEFGIIFPDTDEKEAETIINRIKAMPIDEGNNTIGVTISFGHETKKIAAENIADIIKKTEDHMYRHKLYESSSMRSKTLDMIINTLYEKNHREMLHSKRVSTLCETIATQLNFTTDDINQLRLAGLMHDIGKIGIDEKILNKPDKLNIEEWEEMKRHSEIGYRILSSVNEFSEIAEYVLQHQEKWDGTGYPMGLKGEEISIPARIIGIADAYDAMTSLRSYGTALSKDEAISEMKKYSGIQFDPNIVDIFIEKLVS